MEKLQEQTQDQQSKVILRGLEEGLKKVTLHSPLFSFPNT